MVDSPPGFASSAPGSPIQTSWLCAGACDVHLSQRLSGLNLSTLLGFTGGGKLFIKA